MMNLEITNKILFRKCYLFSTKNVDKTKADYYAAYLLANFGIEVGKASRKKLAKAHLEFVSDMIGKDIPNSYYKNPQDTKYYSSDELLINQILYYFNYGPEAEVIDIFKKDLPQYVEGDEIKLRHYEIIDELEEKEVLESYFNDLCEYRRPFSLGEAGEFIELFEEFYEDQKIQCKDNIFLMIDKYPEELGTQLDKKDLVKLSIKYFGENRKVFKNNSGDTQRKELFKLLFGLVYDCPMSKKQAKYYTKLAKWVGINKMADNNKSPYKIANQKMQQGDVIGAAKIFAENGSLLDRNLKYLLSRASLSEAREILALRKNDNPVINYQLLVTLENNNNEERVFTFFKNNLMKNHVETEYERKWRKSTLSLGMQKELKNSLVEAFFNHYRKLDKQKIFCDPIFEKVAVPINTTGNGKGLDVLPTGSRIPVRGDYIRTFVWWRDAFDIDSSLIVIGKDDSIHTMGWYNASNKEFGPSCLTSGDVVARDGAEFFDIRLSEMEARGYKYVIQVFNGYSCSLDNGIIKCGYQDKDNLETKAWDPKNIEFMIDVKAPTRCFLGFAVDLETKEIIVLNLAKQSNERCVNPSDYKLLKKYLSGACLEINMKSVIDCFAEYVETPEEADIIFSPDTSIKLKEGQEQILPYDLEKLISIVNK